MTPYATYLSLSHKLVPKQFNCAVNDSRKFLSKNLKIEYVSLQILMNET